MSFLLSFVFNCYDKNRKNKGRYMKNLEEMVDLWDRRNGELVLTDDYINQVTSES